ncbi:hypothetical protein SAMN03159494_04673 [Achromobacter sp. NFACC18-2]|nr:hypothetical protein SAMN03159494_04673 [Achromobacter sp. NFACC18-2]
MTDQLQRDLVDLLMPLMPVRELLSDEEHSGSERRGVARR